MSQSQTGEARQLSSRSPSIRKRPSLFEGVASPPSERPTASSAGDEVERIFKDAPSPSRRFASGTLSSLGARVSDAPDGEAASPKQGAGAPPAAARASAGSDAGSWVRTSSKFVAQPLPPRPSASSSPLRPPAGLRESRQLAESATMSEARGNAAGSLASRTAARASAPDAEAALRARPAAPDRGPAAPSPAAGRAGGFQLPPPRLLGRRFGVSASTTSSAAGAAQLSHGTVSVSASQPEGAARGAGGVGPSASTWSAAGGKERRSGDSRIFSAPAASPLGRQNPVMSASTARTVLQQSPVLKPGFVDGPWKRELLKALDAASAPFAPGRHSFLAHALALQARISELRADAATTAKVIAGVEPQLDAILAKYSEFVAANATTPLTQPLQTNALARQLHLGVPSNTGEAPQRPLHNNNTNNNNSNTPHTPRVEADPRASTSETAAASSAWHQAASQWQQASSQWQLASQWGSAALTHGSPREAPPDATLPPSAAVPPVPFPPHQSAHLSPSSMSLNNPRLQRPLQPLRPRDATPPQQQNPPWEGAHSSARNLMPGYTAAAAPAHAFEGANEGRIHPGGAAFQAASAALPGSPLTETALRTGGPVGGTWRPNPPSPGERGRAEFLSRQPTLSLADPSVLRSVSLTAERSPAAPRAAGSRELQENIDPSAAPAAPPTLACLVNNKNSLFQVGLAVVRAATARHPFRPADSPGPDSARPGPRAHPGDAPRPRQPSPTDATLQQQAQQQHTVVSVGPEPPGVPAAPPGVAWQRAIDNARSPLAASGAQSGSVVANRPDSEVHRPSQGPLHPREASSAWLSPHETPYATPVTQTLQARHRYAEYSPSSNELDGSRGAASARQRPGQHLSHVGGAARAAWGAPMASSLRRVLAGEGASPARSALPTAPHGEDASEVNFGSPYQASKYPGRAASSRSHHVTPLTRRSHVEPRPPSSAMTVHDDGDVINVSSTGPLYIRVTPSPSLSPSPVPC